MYTALQDRLVLTLQDIKEWLGVSLDYSNVTVRVIEDPVSSEIQPNYKFFVTLDGQKVTVDSGPTPDKNTIVAAIVAGITGLGITDLTATDNTDGTYTLSSTSTFNMYLSGYQVPEPIYPADGLYEALRLSSLIIADEYINNPFADVDICGNIIAGTERAIPLPLKHGVLQVFKVLLNEQKTATSVVGSSSGTQAQGDIKRHKQGDLETEYFSSSESQSTAESLVASMGGIPLWVQSLLRVWRLEPFWNKDGVNPDKKFALTEMRDNTELEFDRILF